MNEINSQPSPLPAQPPVEAPKSERRQHLRAVISTVLLFLIAPAIALFLTFFVIRSYEVDGPSMNNTLHHGDLLILNKLPKTIAGITGHPYIPKRYEVIIFTRPEISLSGVPETRQLVKRVIALPGERVVVKNGKVTVYNEQFPKGFDPDKNQPHGENFDTTTGNVDVTVNQDEIFVMGDNRGNSLDSRMFGPIKQDDIVGELAVRIFPLNKLRAF